MSYMDTINALQNRNQLKQRKREAAWGSLMDVAGLGSDIWKTLSGRKYNTSEREAAQTYGTNERLGAEAYASGEAATGRNFQAAENQANREHEAAQAELDRQFESKIEASRASREMGQRSEQRMSFLAEWAQRAYQLALGNPQFVDENGNFDMTKKEELRKFLYAQVDGLPMLSPEEINWARKSFDGFVDSWGSTKVSSTPLPPPNTGREDRLQTVTQSVNDLVSKLKEATDLNAQEQQELNSILPALSGGIQGTGPDVGTMKYLMSRLNSLYQAYTTRTGQRKYEVNPAARKR